MLVATHYFLVPTAVFLILFDFFPKTSARCGDRTKSCHRVKHMCGGNSKIGIMIRRSCNWSCGACPLSRSPASVNNAPSAGDSPGCPVWVKNGFCKSTWYKPAIKRQYCPVSCKKYLGSSKRPKSSKKPRSGSRKPRPNKRPPKQSNEKRYAPFREAMDERVKPCHDFYQFACGKYIAARPAKRPGEVHDSANTLTQKIGAKMQPIIMDQTSATLNSVKAMHAYRDKCADNKQAQTTRTKELWATMQSITGGFPLLTDTWDPTAFTLTEALVKMTAASGSVFVYSFNAMGQADGKLGLAGSIAPLMLQDPNVYFDPRQDKKLTKLKDFLTKIINFIAKDQKLKTSEKEIRAGVVDALRFDFEYLQFLFMKSDFGKPPPPGADPLSMFQKIKFSELQKIVTQVKWDDYVRDMPIFDAQLKDFLSKDPDIYINNKKVFGQVDKFYKDADPLRLSNYLFIQFLMKKVLYLDKRFTEAANQFAKDFNAPEFMSYRPQSCLPEIGGHFKWVIEHLYVKKYLSPETVEMVKKMVEDIRGGMATMIGGEKWLDATTKASALKKLEAISEIIGGIDQLKDEQKVEELYSELGINPTDSFDQMSTKLALFKKKINLKQLVDPEYAIFSLGLDAEEVNAKYIPTRNAMFVATGILQPPFLDPKQPAAINYAGIGAVIGHEMTHGFDTNGANYDEKGQKNAWWDPETKKKFDKRAKCFVDQYGKLIEPKSKGRVNGKLTITENVADNGGIRAALLAYKKHLDGKKEPHVKGYMKYTNVQTFFISYARTYCASLAKDVSKRMLREDIHSPARFRVNTVLANFPEFAKAFKCKRGDKMNPLKQCAVW